MKVEQNRMTSNGDHREPCAGGCDPVRRRFLLWALVLNFALVCGIACGGPGDSGSEPEGDGCPEDEVQCEDGECVDLEEDSEHCGDCQNSCSEVAGATADCQEGECRWECEESAEKFCDGRCIETKIDPAHCGECNRDCTENDEFDVPVCVDGGCQDGCDHDTEEACDGTCIDITVSDRHCGGCGQECRSTEQCVDGECEMSDFTIETVAESSGAAPKPDRFRDIETDSQYRPHVSFRDAEDGTVLYGLRTEQEWVFEEVYEEPGDSQIQDNTFSMAASLALNDADKPRIGFGTDNHGLELLGGNQKVARRGGELPVEGHWDIFAVGNGKSSSVIGKHSDLAIDSSGTFHLRFNRHHEKSTQYAVGGPGGWETETIEVDFRKAYHENVALDDDDVPHVVYGRGEEAPLDNYPRASEELVYAAASNGWEREVVNPADIFTSDSSFTLDEDGRPHIVAKTRGRFIFDARVYMRHEEGGWTFEGIGFDWDEYSDIYSGLAVERDDQGHFAGIDVDSEGTPHVSFLDGHGDMKYGRRVDDEWEIVEIEQRETFDTGYWTNIAVDDRGIPHIIYGLREDEVLRYATVE